MAGIAELTATADQSGCRVAVAGRPATVISWRWLREHDEGALGLDPDTGQRRPAGPNPSDGSATAESISVDGSVLRVGWSDGRRSCHRAATLGQVLDDRRSLPDVTRYPVVAAGPEPWSAAPRDLPAPVEFDEVAADDGVVSELLARLLSFGWAQVAGLPKGSGVIEQLAARIGYVRQTIFGGVWELAADLTDHADTAYGSSALAPHTDGTYSHDAPGLQLFACQEKDGSGGESILVDGFAAASDLAEADPEAASLLAAVDVPCRYEEPGVSLRAERPVLRCDHADRLVQVSINAYDRAPFLLGDVVEWERFSSAYERFRTLVEDPDRWLRLGWEPGLLLVFDNWRILHGRGSFTGSRRFLGCYLNHEDLESAWRVHRIH